MSASTTAADKAALRRSMRARRAAVEPAALSAASASVCARVLARFPPAAHAGATWSLFAALPEELDPTTIARAAEAAGVTTLYPRVEHGELTFVPSRLDALVPGHFGVREPRGPGAPLAEARLVIVPGLAFDAHGGRLGYGRGYYDRAIVRAREATPAPLFVGFALDLQRVERVPTTADDQPLDALVTESGWLWFGDRSV